MENSEVRKECLEDMHSVIKGYQTLFKLYDDHESVGDLVPINRLLESIQSKWAQRECKREPGDERNNNGELI